MLNAKSFLAVDFGAANLKLAEFEINEAGGLLLRQYGFKSLGQDGAQEATREPAMIRGLQELLAEKSYGSKIINVCAPGFHTFSKFVKLPPVDTSKVTQIIQYEAQQNVPFPLEEVVWDYQILGSTATGELEVLLVAIKSDIVEGLFRVAETAGLRMQLVDVSPAALCNAFRYNYGDLEGCTMLLDIGAKTSNLLFFEKGSVYSRGINIGANSITQDFAKEARLSFAEAEALKIDEGFVSLGGAYEEPENPNQAAISKIARQVMTRLHIQVNQTVQFYRGQQGGSAPQQLFLSGGAAIMPYTAQFFSEKLNVPVEYFNPLRNVQIDPALNLEELAKVAHSLGEVVGLGLRNLAHCPVELNLMPKSSLKRQQLNQKKPYFVASIFCLVLVVFAIGWFYGRVANEKSAALETLKEKVAPLQQNENKLKGAKRELDSAALEAAQYTTWLENRFYWSGVLTNLRDGLLVVESKKEQELKAKTGVWIEKFTPIVSAATNAPAAASSYATPGNEIATVIMQCRGVNLNNVAPAANTELAFAVAGEFASRTNLFDPAGTTLSGTLVVDESGRTFGFEVTLKLKRPLSTDMLWIKRNLFLAVGGITAIVLLGFGIYLLLANVGKNKGVEVELEEQKAHLESLFTMPAFPNATNIALARQETKRLRDAIAQTKQHFTPVAYEKVTGLAFKSLLDNTIYELHKKAEQASVGLPGKTYSFTFEAQRPQVNFAAGSFPALPEQLAEIKTICHILFDARVNRLVNLRRVRISTDDPPGVNDYHDLKIETNELFRVVTSPYEATFQCFSAELATVLESFYKSPHGFIVKNIMVDTVAEVATAPKAGPLAPAPRPGVRPPPANTNLLETVLNEKLLKVTLLIEVVKPVS